MENLTTRCVIAGGGPAGVMLGLLLARAGVPVVVLEKHADFLRDFRGDTIHPSTLQVMRELGLLEEFLALPHRKVTQLMVQFGDEMLAFGDFRRLRPIGYMAFMPQWDFLDFVADHARAYPEFTLIHNAEVTGLVEEGGRVAGVRVNTDDGPLTVRAELVVGADGRRSLVRDQARLPSIARSVPMDVLWFRISRDPSDSEETFGVLRHGRFMVMINRTTYWQIAYLVPKGGATEYRSHPIEWFAERVAEQEPFLADRVSELKSWDDVSLLEVRVDRLRRWYRPGLLCIGDAAHAMSPIGGVGINLAIQDAVAAANTLAGPLRAGAVGTDVLRRVQRRREIPTRVTQAIQVRIQQRLIAPLLRGQLSVDQPPRGFRQLTRLPLVRTLPALIFGRGLWLEHVKTAARPSLPR